MSKILAVDKSNTRTIYTLSKNYRFYKQITKTLKSLGFDNHNLPVDFPALLTEGEEPTDLKKRIDSFDSARLNLSEDDNEDKNGKSILFIYGKDKIFLIIHSEEQFMEDFNKEFNKNFSF